jgi:hypothetical protein
MKILFVIERRLDAGSIQAVSNYVRAGDECGHTIAIYGREHSSFPGLRFSRDVGSFDYLVFIYESTLRWISGLHLAHILSSVSRQRRVVLDADGMYNQRIVVDGYDRNHDVEGDRVEWRTHCDCLAAKILQPTVRPLEPGVRGVPFYGYDGGWRVPPSAVVKPYDVMHVGHNWWRWQDMSRRLLPALEQVRPSVGDVCFMGLWWDVLPWWAKTPNYEAAVRLEGDWMRRLRIQVKPPVPYRQVIPAMSQGRVNIMTQRPLFRRLRFLTSKYFEVFCADTIPLVMLDPDHAESVYGPAGRELALHEGIGDKLLDTLNRPAKYRPIVEEVRRHLAEHHSYRNRLQQLVEALRARPGVPGEAGGRR